jgi:hypothetical protein
LPYGPLVAPDITATVPLILTRIVTGAQLSRSRWIRGVRTSGKLRLIRMPAMVNRMDYIKPGMECTSRDVASAIHRIARALDWADDQAFVRLNTMIESANNCCGDATAWMMAAVVIADKFDVDSVTLRSLANSIHTGDQSVIF